MEIIFNEEYLREMYNTGRTDKKHRFQPQIIRKYIRVIDLMRDTSKKQKSILVLSLTKEMYIDNVVSVIGFGEGMN